MKAASSGVFCKQYWDDAMINQTTGIEAIELGLSRLKRMCPSGFALGLHIRFASARIMVQTYDPRWIELYTARGYMMCDPLISWGIGSTGCVRWSEMNHPDPHDILGQAMEFGCRYGVAISEGPTGSRSIGGFARGDREFTDAEMQALAETMKALHRASTPRTDVTKGQRHALRTIAAGHRYAEAAVLLGISESALKARLKACRERLMARTTAEAIQRAQELHLL